jgi:agmatinase
MLLRLSTIIFLASVLSKGIHSSETKQQKPFIPPNPEYNMFGGISTFAHVPYENCWDQNAAFDIAFLGIPFDTRKDVLEVHCYLIYILIYLMYIVTSFRPGARFGSAAIREGSRRTKVCGGFNTQLGMNPFTTDLKIVDCGDLQLE